MLLTLQPRVRILVGTPDFLTIEPSSVVFPKMLLRLSGRQSNSKIERLEYVGMIQLVQKMISAKVPTTDALSFGQ